MVLVLACDITWGYSGALPSSSNLESAYALLAHETKNAQVNVWFIEVLTSIQKYNVFNGNVILSYFMSYLF